MLHYNITKLIPVTTMRPWFLTLLLCVAVSAHAVQQPDTAHPDVVASIKPVHSLVAAIMQGVGQPELLLSSNQSPHHYSLRPSERRKLANADLVFWIGPGMESFMSRLINNLDKNTVVIPLIETSGLLLKPLRSQHGHGDEHDKQLDPHIWLNTTNIENMADEITRQLTKIDPSHKTEYENNTIKLKKRTLTLRNNLRRLFKGTDQPFLTYHDGYQYFEDEFALNNAGFVSVNPEIQPGAGHIRKLKQLIQQRTIHCVFYDAPVKPPVINSLLSNSNAQSIELDATGMMLPAGKDNLLQTMESLGENFSKCLLSRRK